MPTYQRAAILRGVVDNVLRQDFTDFELWVMDDGSTDGTKDMMEGITDLRLHYRRPGRMGVPAILNEGFRHVRGEFVIILHDHDIYEPDMLSTFVDFMDAHPNVAFVFSGLVLCDSSGEKEVTRDIHMFPDVTPGLTFLRTQFLPRVDSCVGVFCLVRRKLLQDRFLEPAVGGAADVELWHRLCTRGDVGYIRRPLIRVRGRDPRSQFFLAESELVARVLRAKKPYLEYAENDGAKSAALRNWRGAATRTVFSNLYKCLAAKNTSALGAVQTLADEWGGPAARAAVAMVRTIPRPASVALLSVARRLGQIFRSSRPRVIVLNQPGS